jgi:apolipoprotein N-acyltransferase
LATKAPTPVVVIAGLLLTAYLVPVVRAWLAPSGDDPQRGAAAGFLMMVTLFLLFLVGLLWYGATHHRAGMVWTVFVICVLPSLSLVARGIYLLVRWMKGAN